MKSVVLIGASLISIAWCGQAGAQTTSDSGTSQSGNADQDQSGQDIVVTAQRRNERLQTTPIAASVLTGADLANRNIVNVDQLQFAMPSVAVDNFGQGLEFNIRGIGKAEHNTQTLTGVITYRDGVATFPGYFQGEPYFDIARVEVLRGPQGTIAGQNSTGGAVFVTTNDPIIGGGAHGYLLGQFGSYSDAGLQGAINLPISDTFAARIAWFTERRGGFYDITGPGGTPYTGNNGDLREAAGRISFLWRPTDRLSILSKTDVDYLDYGAYPADPYYARFRVLPGTSTPNPYYNDLFDISLNSPQGAKDSFVRSTLRIDYEFDGGVRLRSISGYQNGTTKYRADLDGLAAPTVFTPNANQTFFDNVGERIWSQEINLISPDDQRFTWLLGAYGQWNTYYFRRPFQFVIGVPEGNPATEYRLEGTNPQRDLAFFGQVGFRITPQLKLELGGRYTWSHTRNDVQVIQYGVPIDDQQSARANDFSWKASLGWEINRNQYLYAFAATGFRAGGLNVPVGLGLPDPFEPEKVTSFEAGWRANFLGGHIRTTLNGFYNNYRNFQVIIGYPLFPTFGIEVNVPDTTRIYGAEFEAEAHLGRFSFDFGVSAIHSSLGQFFATDPRLPSVLPCDPNTGPASATCLNLKGREQTYAPNFTFNAGAQYVFNLGNAGTLTPRVNFGHVAAQWATLFENPALGDRLEDRNILGAQLAWTKGPWTVTLYGTNLTNQHYVGALNSGLDFAGPPRQYGISVLRLF